MEYETNVSAESNQKFTESDAEEANPGTHYIVTMHCLQYMFVLRQ